MPDLSALRARTGRPHWLIIDEAHHLMPAARDSASLALSDDRSGMIMITVHPDSVSPDALKEITAVAALGPKARDVIATICSVFDEALPAGLDASFGEDEVLFWRRTPPTPVRRIKAEQPGKPASGIRANMRRAGWARRQASISAVRRTR